MNFYERFESLGIDVEEARRRFTTRVLLTLFPNYPRMGGNRLIQFNAVRKALGEPVRTVEDVESLVRSDFYRLLDMLERLMAGWPSTLDFVQRLVETADIDIGITWNEGKFHPRGAKLLDDRLINDPLEWLKNANLPTVYEPFEKALNHLLRARADEGRLADAVTDAYDALEAIAKAVCESDKKFDQLREQYVSKIGASREFKAIAKALSDYAHVFRHGSSVTMPKPALSYAEVESFLYVVGIFTRLGTESLDRRD